MTKRIEKDSLGEKKIKKDVLYGIQTLRSKENYPISGASITPEMIKAYAQVKIAAAQANIKLGKLDKKLGELIIKASKEVLSGEQDKYFIVDVFQAGAGTATNMNINEVIANRVLEMMGEKKGNYTLVSPNDHVNMSQSTNDTYPTAMRIAILNKYDKLNKSIKLLEKSFKQKSREFSKIIKTGRTHLQDAVPITLGQEFEGWSYTIAKLRKELEQANNSLLELSIGGTAIGTGINTHKKYASTTIKYLQKNTGLKLKESKNKISGTQSQAEILKYSGVLKHIVIEITRIILDLKLLSSGPNTGFGEIELPAVQPGSSIMPGKINPSIIECFQMISYRIIGSETTVAYCVGNGQLELNTNMPLMSYELISSLKILNNGLDMLREKCINGITANEDICKKYAHESSSLATILNPILGYTKVAELVKKQIKTKKSIVEIVLKEGILSKKELEKILEPKNLTKPN